MEQAVSRRKKVKIIIAPTYDDSRAKIALWNDTLRSSRKTTEKEQNTIMMIWFLYHNTIKPSLYKTTTVTVPPFKTLTVFLKWNKSI